MDCRNSRGASGNRPRIDWLPMTMNSISPVRALDARRMCSRSARFIALENFGALLLRHDNRKGRAVTQPARLFSCITQDLENTSKSTLIDKAEPFLECVLGLNCVIGIGQSGFDPLDDSF